MLEPIGQKFMPSSYLLSISLMLPTHAIIWVIVVFLFVFFGGKSLSEIRGEKQKRDFFSLWGDMKTIYTSTSVHIDPPLANVAFITHDFCYCFFRSCYDRTRAEHRSKQRPFLFSPFYFFLFFYFFLNFVFFRVLFLFGWVSLFWSQSATRMRPDLFVVPFRAQTQCSFSTSIGL